MQQERKEWGGKDNTNSTSTQRGTLYQEVGSDTKVRGRDTERALGGDAKHCYITRITKPNLLLSNKEVLILYNQRGSPLKATGCYRRWHLLNSHSATKIKVKDNPPLFCLLSSNFLMEMCAESHCHVKNELIEVKNE